MKNQVKNTTTTPEQTTTQNTHSLTKNEELLIVKEHNDKLKKMQTEAVVLK